MRIYLCGIESALCSAWRDQCSHLPGVSILESSLFEVDVDAIVSPANSFGFMDGGIDLQISEFFDWEIEKRVKAAIEHKHFGELLVGQAELIHTGHAVYPYLITAPTMRMPEVLPADTINPYLATRAVLQLLVYGRTLIDGEELAVNRIIKSIAIPGMGTGIGGVAYERCARQMALAIRDVLVEPAGMPPSWDDATDRYLELQQ